MHHQRGQRGCTRWPEWADCLLRRQDIFASPPSNTKIFTKDIFFWSREFSSYKIGDCYLDLDLFLLGHVLWSVPMVNHHQIPPFEGIPSRELTYPPKMFFFFKMIFLFLRWDMLIYRRVLCCFFFQASKQANQSN